MTPQQMVVQRTDGFKNLYHGFYGFYVKELARDSSPFSKYQLQLSTHFFDMYLELTRIVYPLFEQIISNVDEKRAVARAALYDALVAHSFGTYQDNMAASLSERIANLEDAVSKLSLIKAKEPVNAISEGKQSVTGSKARQPK
jgi:hypothetical protein